MSVLLATNEDGVGHLVLNRPDVRNAFNRELIDALRTQLDAWLDREDLRAVVISGAGEKAFASGADVNDLLTRTHTDAFAARLSRLFDEVAAFPRPTIAAIDGYALGGGLELAMACDLRVASKAARLGLPEVTLGLFPSAGGTTRLPSLVGLGRARELIFTGRIVEAAEALSLGLVEHLVETDAVAAALTLAKTIAENSPPAVRVAKAALSGSTGPLGQSALVESADKTQRLTDFLAKKKR